MYDHGAFERLTTCVWSKIPFSLCHWYNWRSTKKTRPQKRELKINFAFHFIYVDPFYFQWAIPGLFFFFFRLFNTVDSKEMFNINFGR